MPAVAALRGTGGLTDAPVPRVDGHALLSEQSRALDEDGYLILRDAIPSAWLAPLRDFFERTVLAHDRWPVPREKDTRHAVLYGDVLVTRACLLPNVLAATAHILNRRFFFDWVQGRDPDPKGGAQGLHRDWVPEEGPTGVVTVLGFLDDYGTGNGATRLVPGSHMIVSPDCDALAGSAVIVAGRAGDVLVFGGRLVHSGIANVSGLPRRTLQACFSGIELLDSRRARFDLPPLDEGEQTFYDPA